MASFAEGKRRFHRDLAADVRLWPAIERVMAVQRVVGERAAELRGARWLDAKGRRPWER